MITGQMINSCGIYLFLSSKKIQKSQKDRVIINKSELKPGVCIYGRDIKSLFG